MLWDIAMIQWSVFVFIKILLRGVNLIDDSREMKLSSVRKNIHLFDLPL